MEHDPAYLEACRRDSAEAYAAWHRDFTCRMDDHHARLLLALEEGQTITEHMPTRDVAWPEAWAAIIPSGRTPAQVAKHLLSRHRGFGWDHTIRGVRYHLGRAI
jgi:hypothetical protein